jgi:hypothetical protein
MIPAGGRYLVAAAPSVIVPPASPSLTSGPFGASVTASWEEALSIPILLPFVLPYPGGSSGAITIGSNGFVYLEYETTATFDVIGAPYGDLSVFRDNRPRIAAYFHDLDPSAGGGIHYEEDPAGSFVRITWLSVPEWGVPSALNTMQLTLHAGGQVDVAYGALGNGATSNDAIVGFTPGYGSRLPPVQDLSATMPFRSGDGAVPPRLGIDARPVVGASPDLRATGLAPGTAFVLHSIGLTAPAASVDLGFVGMPGCRLQIDPLATRLAPAAGGASTSPLGKVPNDPAWLGVALFAQAAPLSPGFNAAGVLLSNGVCLRIGAL